MKKIILITIQLGLCFFVPAQTLVKDINPGNGYSLPRNFVALGNLTLFIASDNLHGYELWKTDGTTLGTSLVMDINPGVADGLYFTDGTSTEHYTPLVVMGSKVYFFANDGSTGFELWSSDGTTSGTAIVKDINPGSGDAVFELYTSIAIMGNELYFRADDGTDGAELWKSDGTALGTSMVKNINPSVASYPDNLHPDGNLIYFSADDGTNGREPWISDGTTLGTRMLADINSGSNGSDVQEFTKFNNKIYFNANNGIDGYELWTTDGTTSGTQLLKDINPSINSSSSPWDFIVYNNHLFFDAYDGTNGSELWYTDGTTPGTLLLKNIFPGSGSGYPYELTLFDGKIFFQANDGTHGAELWSTDGTTLGTSLFLDINNGTNQSSSPYDLTVANGSLYFSATDGTNGYELWKTDGTIAGTSMLNQICPGSCDGFPSNKFQNGNTLFFSAYETTTGYELYKLDLPTTGINELSENNLKVYPNPFSSQLQVKGTGANGELVLFDILGKDILRQKTYSSETTINTENLSPGIYLLSYLNGNKTINIKITKF